jgi:4'-phosphopantetheinyl transferase EntD
LFNDSQFFFIEKKASLSDKDVELLTRFVYENSETFHPERKKEFLLGRLCASRAYEQLIGSELISLPVNPDRSPHWPPQILGSISHNQFLVGAVVSNSKNLIGVGIDFEVVGRVRPELIRYITNSQDLTGHHSLTQEELLTIIFSAKESLYKALFPLVKKFFGFEAAALREIDCEKGEFTIDLINQISEEFGPEKRYQFKGRFLISTLNCLTVLEILK